MTDDEKMMLVAKACGWTLAADTIFRGQTRYWCQDLSCEFLPKENTNIMAEIVAKLGLLLQVRLEREIGSTTYPATAYCMGSWPNFHKIESSVPANGNMKAALCRAVFEVAAKIGETL